MKSKIHMGDTWHCRHKPKKHFFHYPLYFLELDLSELDELSKRTRLFSYNRFSVFSIWDKDFLKAGSESIKNKLESYLKSKGLSSDFHRIVLVTSPKYFGYSFNPVSFYCCYDQDGTLEALICEVNNTFSEKHIYLSKSAGTKDSFLKFTFPKEFYVSPLFNVDGDYEVLLKHTEKSFDIRVNINRDGEQIFSSRLAGLGSEVTTKNILKVIAKFPFSGWLTMTRIHVQALLLRFAKKIPFYLKPEPSSSETIRSGRASVFSRIRSFLISLTKAETVTEVGRKDKV